MANKVATFQERFNELLDLSPKSRSTIAKEFGVAKQTISAWATGQSSPRTPVATSLAEYFDVSLPWLLGFDVPMREDKQSMDYYLKYLNSVIEGTEKIGMIFPDEATLIESYRFLSPRGKDLLLDRCEELKVLYGKKPEDPAAESI